MDCQLVVDGVQLHRDFTDFRRGEGFTEHIAHNRRHQRRHAGKPRWFQLGFQYAHFHRNTIIRPPILPVPPSSKPPKQLFCYHRRGQPIGQHLLLFRQ